MLAGNGRRPHGVVAGMAVAVMLPLALMPAASADVPGTASAGGTDHAKTVAAGRTTDGAKDRPYAELARGKAPGTPYTVNRELKAPDADGQLAGFSHPLHYERVAGGWMVIERTEDYHEQMWFVGTDGHRRQLAENNQFSFEGGLANADGSRFAWSIPEQGSTRDAGPATTVAVADGKTGQVLARLSVDAKGAVTVAGMVGDRVVFNAKEPRSDGMHIWDPADGSVTVVPDHFARVTDGTSLVATDTSGSSDPCEAVLDAANGNAQLWKRCGDGTVSSFSPGGSYVLLGSGTTAELADPRTGKELTSFTWKFNAWQTRWESDDALLVNPRDYDRNAILRLSTDDLTRELATVPRDDPGGVDGISDPPYNLGTPSYY